MHIPAGHETNGLIVDMIYMIANYSNGMYRIVQKVFRLSFDGGQFVGFAVKIHIKILKNHIPGIHSPRVCDQIPSTPHVVLLMPLRVYPILQEAVAMHPSGTLVLGNTVPFVGAVTGSQIGSGSTGIM